MNTRGRRNNVVEQLDSPSKKSIKQKVVVTSPGIQKVKVEPIDVPHATRKSPRGSSTQASVCNFLSIVSTYNDDKHRTNREQSTVKQCFPGKKNSAGDTPGANILPTVALVTGSIKKKKSDAKRVVNVHEYLEKAHCVQNDHIAEQNRSDSRSMLDSTCKIYDHPSGYRKRKYDNNTLGMSDGLPTKYIRKEMVETSTNVKDSTIYQDQTSSLPDESKHLSSLVPNIEGEQKSSIEYCSVNVKFVNHAKKQDVDKSHPDIKTPGEGYQVETSTVLKEEFQDMGDVKVETPIFIVIDGKTVQVDLPPGTKATDEELVRLVLEQTEVINSNKASDVEVISPNEEGAGDGGSSTGDQETLYYTWDNEVEVVEEIDQTNTNLDMLLAAAAEMTNKSTTVSGIITQSKVDVPYPHISIQPVDYGYPLMPCVAPPCGCGQYHCPLCVEETVGNLANMKQHYDAHVRKGCNHKGLHVLLCQLNCESSPHLHCPTCGIIMKTQNGRITKFINHISTCATTRSQNSKDEVQLKSVPEDSVPTPDGPVLVPHPSIIHSNDSLKAQLCASDNDCNCGNYHCPLCTKQNHTSRYLSKSNNHVVCHLKHFVPFHDYKVLICMLGCDFNSHYHCPMCGNTYRRKKDVREHIENRCRGYNQRRNLKKLKRLVQEKQVSSDMADGSPPEIPFPHKSIVLGDDELRPVHCSGICEKCLGENVLCPLCPFPTVLCMDKLRIGDHILSHTRKGVPYKGYMIMPCGGDTCIKYKPRGFHYHCPECAVILVLREHIISHVFNNCKMKKCYVNRDYACLRKDPSVTLTKPQGNTKAKETLLNNVKATTVVNVKVVPTPRRGKIIRNEEFSADNSLRDEIVKKTSSENQSLASTVVSIKQEPHSPSQNINESFPEKQAQLSADNPVAVIQTPDDENPTCMHSREDRRIHETPYTPVKDKEQSPMMSGLKTEAPRQNTASISAITPNEVLKKVTAELTSHLLDKAFSGPTEVLLDHLCSLLRTTWCQVESTNAFQITGSWQQIVKMSSIITKMIEDGGKSEDDLAVFMKPFVQEEEMVDLHAVELHSSRSNQAAANESIIQREDTLSSDVNNIGTENTQETQVNPVNSTNSNTELNEYNSGLLNEKSLDVITQEETLLQLDTESPELDINEGGTMVLESQDATMFECPVCSKSFSKPLSIIQHLMTHAACMEEEAFQKACISLQNIHRSILLVEEPKCPICAKMFSAVHFAVLHHANETCNRTYNKRMVQEYKIKKSLGGLHHCSMCKYNTKSAACVVSHFEKNHCDQTLLCSYENCGKMFATEEAVMRHQLIHEQAVPCELCGLSLRKGYMKHHLANQHMDTSTLPHNHSCSKCSYSSWSKINLQSHMKNMHRSRDFSCELCSKSFTHFHKLQYHKQTKHEGKERYQSNMSRQTAACPECNVVIFQKNLKRHIRTVHRKIKSFSCNICYKAFTNAQSMRHHARLHTNSSTFDYACNVCKKGFNKKWWYDEHIRNAHTGHKQFECELCGKRFRFKILYKRHMLAHQQSSGLECDICNKIYRTSKQLQSHREADHQASYIGCSCGFTFSSVDNFQEHSKSCDSVRAGILGSEPMLAVVEDGTVNLNGEKYIVAYDYDLVGLTNEPQTSVTNEHLEAAHTLESFASTSESAEPVVLTSETDDGRILTTSHTEVVLTNTGEEILVNSSNGQVLNTVEAQGSMVEDVNCGGNEINIADIQGVLMETASSDTDELSHSSLQTIIMQTDDGGQIRILTQDGNILSQEVTDHILQSVNDGEQGIKSEEFNDESQGNVPVEATESGKDMNSGEIGGYMCGFCSSIFSAIEDVQQHIDVKHSEEVALQEG